MEKEESGYSENDVCVDFEIPSQYKVIIMNDDWTTMEFVVDVLMSVFHKTVEEATTIMLSVHQTGKGIVGIYPLDIAETRTRIAIKKARENGFPLQIVVEKA